MKLLDFKYDYLSVFKLSLLSRIFYLLIGWISSLIFQKFDKSSNLYQITSPFKYLLSWDSIHFLNIAKEGYTYEHSIVFFPLMPFLTRLIPFFDHFSIGIFLNNLFFILSSMLLYKLSLKKYSLKIAFNSIIFFNFNPASIIFSSFYTESLFCLLFLIGFYYIQDKKFLKASIIFSFSSLTRSNSLIFLLFFKSLYFPIILIPIFIFQFNFLFKFFEYNCTFKFFIPYTKIQKIYWNQGFLNFLHFKNICNMMFGIIPIIHSLFIIKLYFEFLFKKNSNFNNLSFNNFKKKIYIYLKSFFFNFFSIKYIKNLFKDPFSIEFISDITKLFIILSIQIFGLIFFMHWNMAYRFLSFNPILYWSFAHLQSFYHKNKLFKFIMLFHFIYSIIYTILFSTYYPPA